VRVGKTFSYTASPVDQTTGNAAIQDLSGNDAFAITNSVITNSSTVDQTSPQPITTNSVKVSQDIVTISFDEVLQSNPTAAAGSYSVTVGATSYPVSAVSVNGKVVELTLSSAIPAGAIVRVVYNSPSSTLNTNTALQDSGGNDVLAFDSSTTSPSTWAWTSNSAKTSGFSACSNQSHNNGSPYTTSNFCSNVLNSAKHNLSMELIIQSV
jgi:hypothetical protein